MKQLSNIKQYQFHMKKYNKCGATRMRLWPHNKLPTIAICNRATWLRGRFKEYRPQQLK